VQPRLILKKLPLERTRLASADLQRYHVVRWIPPKEIVQKIWEQWELVLQERGGCVGSICSESPIRGTLGMSLDPILQDSELCDKYELGCDKKNSSGFELAVLAFNRKYSNNKGISLDDVIW
jgi:hypothetical protein